MKIGLLLPSIYMYPRFAKGRIFAPRMVAEALANGLVDRGHDVFFYTTPGVSTKATLVAGDESLLEKDLQYFLIRNRNEEEKKWTTLEATKRDFELALTMHAYQDGQKGKLDIIHSLHDFAAHYFNELTGFPTVYTLHDPLDKGPDTIEHHRFKRFTHHAYVSISNAQRLGSTLNFVETIYHGINLDQFPLGQGSGGYVMFFGRLMEDKGPDVAIVAAKKANVRLKIATSNTRANMSEKYYQEKIKPFIDGIHVNEVGFMEAEEKAAFIGNAKAFLFPLQWEEPFGLVMIEAMACGTPVIAYNRGSVSEIVRDGITGFIIDQDDQDRPKKGSWIIKKQGIEGLVEAIKRIGEIDRAACRKHVEDNFTVEKMVIGYEEVYKQVVGSSGQSEKSGVI